MKRKSNSPIENGMRQALLFSLPRAGLCVTDLTHERTGAMFDPDHPDLLLVSTESDEPCGDVYGTGDEEWTLYSDVSLGTYRIDLLLQTFYGHLAIECDGHEWHERTKQQAAYDRARDRELLAHGLATVRFTGSEIHHSAARCAQEVYAVMRHIDDRESSHVHARTEIRRRA